MTNTSWAVIAVTVILLSGLASFNFGVFIWNQLVKFRAKRSAICLASGRGIATLTARALVILLLLYKIEFAVYLVHIANLFGLATMFTDPTSIRSFIGEPYLASVPLPARILLYLGPVILGLFGLRGAIDQPIPPRWRLLKMLALGILMFAMLQRKKMPLSRLMLVAAALNQPAPNRSGDKAKKHNIRSPFPRFITARWRPFVVAALLVVAPSIAFQLVGSAFGKSEQQTIQSGSVSSARRTPVFANHVGSAITFLKLTESNNSSLPQPIRTAWIPWGNTTHRSGEQ
jgi:hypothetical protein